MSVPAHCACLLITVLASSPHSIDQTPSHPLLIHICAHSNVSRTTLKLRSTRKFTFTTTRNPHYYSQPSLKPPHKSSCPTALSTLFLSTLAQVFLPPACPKSLSLGEQTELCPHPLLLPLRFPSRLFLRFCLTVVSQPNPFHLLRFTHLFRNLHVTLYCQHQPHQEHQEQLSLHRHKRVSHTSPPQAIMLLRHRT